MGRSLRAASGNHGYHVLNRANVRRILFEDEGDHAAFEWLSGEQWFLTPLSGPSGR